MPPEVLAWTLLFVVAFAVVYRFFAWVGKRLGRKPSAVVSLQAVTDSVVADRAAPEPVAIKLVAAEPVDAEPAIVAPIVPPVESSVDEVLASPTETPSPSPLPLAAAPEIVALPIPVAPIASARVAPEVVRTALAPSVAATLPPRPVPSVEPALPPAPVQPPVAEADPVDSAPLEKSPAMAAATPSDLRHDEVSGPDAEPKRAAPSSSQPFQGVVEVSKPVVFRARRIGLEAARLDTRLRDSRERRNLPAPKILRGPSELIATKGLKVLMAKDAREKTPARRIGRKTGCDILFATSRAQTRIIGTPSRPSRILAWSAL